MSQVRLIAAHACAHLAFLSILSSRIEGGLVAPLVAISFSVALAALSWPGVSLLRANPRAAIPRLIGYAWLHIIFAFYVGRVANAWPGPPRISLFLLYFFSVVAVVYFAWRKNRTWPELFPVRLLGWFLVPLFMFYTANTSLLQSSDSRASALVPISIVHERNANLDEFYGGIEFFNEIFSEGIEAREQLEMAFVSTTSSEGVEILHPQFVGLVDDHFVPAFPVFSTVFSLPAYALLHATGVLDHPGLITDTPQDKRSDTALERITAAWIGVLAVLFFFLIARRLLGSTRRGLLVALLYALATFHYTIGSQALWQHGTAELWMLAGIYFTIVLNDAPSKQTAMLVGACFCAIACTRPQNFFIPAMLLLFVAGRLYARHRSIAWPVYLSLGALLPLLLFLGFNLAVYNHPLGGYAITQHLYFSSTREAFSGDMGEGLYGLLFAPGRGLFLYSPILLLGISGTILQRRRTEVWLIAAIVVVQIIYYANYALWWGGKTYGPRFLGETVPLLMLLALPIFHEPVWRRIWVRVLVAIMALFSFAMQLAGIATDDAFSRWNEHPHVDTYRERLFDWSRPPFLAWADRYRSIRDDESRYCAAHHLGQGAHLVQSDHSDCKYIRSVGEADQISWVLLQMEVFLKEGAYVIAIDMRATGALPARTGVIIGQNAKPLAAFPVEVLPSEEFQTILVPATVPEAGLYEISIKLEPYNGKVAIDDLIFHRESPDG